MLKKKSHQLVANVLKNLSHLAAVNTGKCVSKSRNVEEQKDFRKKFESAPRFSTSQLLLKGMERKDP